MGPCVILNADLNVVAEPAGVSWPEAVLAGLRSCIRKALAERSSTFQVLGTGPRWRIVPLRGRQARCIAIFAEQEP